MEWIELDGDGVIVAQRIVAIGPAESAPMRRLLAAVSPDKIIVLTGGRRRQSLIVLDSDHVVISALNVTELLLRLAVIK